MRDRHKSGKLRLEPCSYSQQYVGFDEGVVEIAGDMQKTLLLYHAPQH